MAFTTLFQPLQDLTDLDLVERFQEENDEEALHVLLVRYRRLVWGKARSYFLVGADADDLEQEGMIGLFKAARDFKSDRQVSFRAFADVCVTRQMITAIKTATRHKHQPLNRYLPIAGPRTDDDSSGDHEESLVDTDCMADPIDAVIAGEQLSSMRARLSEMLSTLEVDVLRLYVEGRSYEEISAYLGRHVKSVDNALQRIKRKLEGHLQDTLRLAAWPSPDHYVDRRCTAPG